MNKVYKLISVLIAGVFACTFFSSCGEKEKVPDYSNVANRITPDSIANTEIPQIEFASNAKKGEYVSSDKVVQIALLGDNVEISGNGAVYETNSLKINMGGTYILSGSLNNGDIIVNLPDTEKSKLNLILNGVFINCSDGPVLNVENSPKKVMIYTAEGSVNVFCDGENYVSDISTANACVYSSADLVLDGKGELYIISNCAKGVHSKDDVDVIGGKIFVSSADDGIQGNDAVKIKGGSIYIKSGGDGIKSTSAKGGKGNVSMLGGELYIKSALDGIQAQNNFTLSDGIVSIKCVEGIADKKSEGFQNSEHYPMKNYISLDNHKSELLDKENNDKPKYSCKAIKAANILKITGGNVCINTPDSGLFSGNIIEIEDGKLLIYSGNDGLYANNNLTVNGGILQIKESFEGLESKKIVINGGYISLKSKDDGFNACGGYSSEYGDNDFPDSGDTKNGVVYDNPEIIINNGTVIINAEGDGIDSNGNIYMHGGFMAIFGPTSGIDSAIDYGDGNNNMTISGGTLIAVGSSEMAKTATGDGQGVISFSCKGTADVILTVTDSSDNVVFSVVPPKKYKSVVFSCKAMKKGDVYKIYSGGTHSGSVFDCVYDAGTVENANELGSLKAK